MLPLINIIINKNKEKKIRVYRFYLCNTKKKKEILSNLSKYDFISKKERERERALLCGFFICFKYQ